MAIRHVIALQRIINILNMFIILMRTGSVFIPKQKHMRLMRDTMAALSSALNLSYQALMCNRIHMPIYPLLFPYVDPVIVRKDVFGDIRMRNTIFWRNTGETPESFIALCNFILPIYQQTYNVIFVDNFINKVLIVFIWMRQYLPEDTLAAWFGTSQPSVSRYINMILPVLWEALVAEVRWPTAVEWQAKSGIWDMMPQAVGAIDGTVHHIYVPSTEPQVLFYRRDKHTHCLSTQVIMDNSNNIVYIHSGFLGRCNDAAQYNMLPDIGPNQPLDFPQNTYLLADAGYANRYPLLTPYQNPALLANVNRQLFNKIMKSYRSLVEHRIRDLKTYRCLSSRYWRHARWMLPITAEVCAALTNRHFGLCREVRGHP